MPPAKNSVAYSHSSRSFPGEFHWSSLIAAVFAMLIVQLFRADVHPSLPWMFCEIGFFVMLSVGLYGVGCLWFDGDRPRQTPAQGITFFTQASALLIAVLVVVWQFVSRSFGTGDAIEIVSLVTLQHVAFFLALLATVASYEKLSLVLNAALVFFVSCMTDRWDIYLFIAIFAVIALWWLLGIYWSRLNSKAIDGESRMLSIHGSSIGITTVMIGLAAGIAYLAPLPKGISVDWGFMPFSGGREGFADEFARSGIGDGDMLTAGQNASTTGAVDSEQFIEDDKPSMYDMISDSYDLPVIKKKRNRAVALDSFAKHLEKVKQSEVAGRSFRTMRESDQEKDADLEGRETDALFFVEGSVPARFRIGSYQNFDGWDWQSQPVQDQRPILPRITLKQQSGKPVFSLMQHRPDFLTSRRYHRFKVMRLDTDVLPSPSFLNAWHIYKVDQLNFFAWNETGEIKYDGDAIPSQTLIDLESYVPNYHVMRRLGDLRFSAGSKTWWQRWFASDAKLSPSRNNDADSIFLQVPDTDARPALQNSVAQWTEGIEPGWKQVEAIVHHIKNDFQVDSDWDVDQDAADTVGQFLQLQRGPTYMFATTCTMALRSAGYKARLSNGFLVCEEDYDRVARQSQVDGDNIHFWPEVCLDDRHWIPVEPTPGCPVPYSTQTLWQWMTTQVFLCLRWVWARPLTAGLVTMASVLAIAYRAELLLWCWLLWWHIIRWAWPTKLLTTTRQLIDARCWLAGNRRPDCQTIQAWYRQIEPGLPNSFFDFWNAKNYSNSAQIDRRDVLVASCLEPVQAITLQKIRRDLESRNENKLRKQNDC